ncbi:uncharacterized protein LOC129618518 [Condylostylus longicornis]|uniref:uncharacterized protein LOC129618518 n=1 Tax=Condylostylus longicornis TaxID=2530218 RepID=UPI00244DE3DB|nr:uncharacterized protein LOC129618518 [Condylostylus longicornis]
MARRKRTKRLENRNNYKVTQEGRSDAMQKLDGIVEKLDASIREEQAFFRQSRGYTEPASTLRLIIEQSIEWNNPLYATFIDFERAFDSIKRSMIWTTLKRHRIVAKVINIIRSLYDNAETMVSHNGRLSTPITTTAGVRQGYKEDKSNEKMMKNMSD